MDKAALRERMSIIWPNVEEKEYLLGLIDSDLVKLPCGSGSYTKTSAATTTVTSSDLTSDN